MTLSKTIKEKESEMTREDESQMRAEEAKGRKESEWRGDRGKHGERWKEGHEVCSC